MSARYGPLAATKPRKRTSLPLPNRADAPPLRATQTPEFQVPQSDCESLGRQLDKTKRLQSALLIGAVSARLNAACVKKDY